MPEIIDIGRLAIYGGVALLLVVAILAVSWVLGQRHRERATGEPYESGVMPTGSARLRVSPRFYLVAMLFVIFDLEAAFIFAWAVAARQLGWQGLAGAGVFIAVLGIALVYELRVGALDFGPRQRPGGAPAGRR